MDESVHRAIALADQAASDYEDWLRRAKPQEPSLSRLQTDAETQSQWNEKWNEWFDQRAMDFSKQVIVEFVCEYVHRHLGKMRAEFREEIRKIPHGRDGRSIIGPEGPPGKDGVMIFGEQQERGVVLDLPQFVKKRDLNA